MGALLGGEVSKNNVGMARDAYMGTIGSFGTPSTQTYMPHPYSTFKPILLNVLGLCFGSLKRSKMREKNVTSLHLYHCSV